MDKNYYLEYYDLERNNWWFKARQEIIRSQIIKLTEGKTNISILNIGVATGASSIMLAEFGKVKSIEFDAECFEFVKEKLDIDIEQGSILELQFEPNSFDLVCAFDVIEHVENDQLAAIEMMRVCKPGGFVFVTVPAFMSLYGKHDIVNHHFRRYKSDGLKMLFSEQGSIVYDTYFNSVLFIPIFLVRIINKLIPGILKSKGSGSDFGMIQSKFLDRLFYKIFMFENGLLKKATRFPFGVSAMLIWKK
ncbi:MAG: class I SAM-dependent methyltransferase [Bacteroidota bacterium]|nr:class I SAM-dependent methyltransferase [Bacteroidota bacterium]